MTIARRTSRDQVLAFRLDNHHLSYRRPPGALLDTAAACGVRNTPPGSAALALHARIASLTPKTIDRALREDKTLVEVLGMRSSPQVVPTRDAAVFTLGALPADEASLRTALLSLGPALDEVGLSASAALQAAADAAWAELDGQMLARGTLSEAMTRRLPDVLAPWCPGCQAQHVHEMLFRLVGVRGVFALVRRADKDIMYVRTDQWLGERPNSDRGAARAALLRRYLRCFGPSTAEHFAAWAGLTPTDARLAWDAVVDQLVEADWEGHRAWLHAADATRFDNPSSQSGVRFLPPHDPYLDQRDRATLLPDKELHRRVWRPLGNPGVVVGGGQIVGLWRPQKKGKRLVVNVEMITPVSRAVRVEIQTEATLLAPYRSCASGEVAFTAEL